MPTGVPISLHDWLEYILPHHEGLESAGTAFTNMPSQYGVHRALHLVFPLRKQSASEPGSTSSEGTRCFNECIEYLHATESIFSGIDTGDRPIKKILNKARTEPGSLFTIKYMRPILHMLPLALSGVKRRRVLIGTPTIYGGKWLMMEVDGLTIAGVC
jgi:hypothetical protein